MGNTQGQKVGAQRANRQRFHHPHCSSSAGTFAGNEWVPVLSKGKKSAKVRFGKQGRNSSAPLRRQPPRLAWLNRSSTRRFAQG